MDERIGRVLDDICNKLLEQRSKLIVDSARVEAALIIVGNVRLGIEQALNQEENHGNAEQPDRN